MKKLLMASAVTALMAAAAHAEDIKLGIVIGFTGPLESLTGSMAAAAEMAMAEVTASGKLYCTFSSHNFFHSSSSVLKSFLPDTVSISITKKFSNGIFAVILLLLFFKNKKGLR